MYEFVADGPLVTIRDWQAVLRQKQFTGVAPLVRRDGGLVTVEYAGHPEIVTGKQLVIFVASRASRGSRRLRDENPPSRPDLLTDRELEVVALLARGYTGPEIAEELQLAHNTVRSHVHNIMTKLGTRSRAQIVAKSLGEGILWTAS